MTDLWTCCLRTVFLDWLYKIHLEVSRLNKLGVAWEASWRDCYIHNLQNEFEIHFYLKMVHFCIQTSNHHLNKILEDISLTLIGLTFENYVEGWGGVDSTPLVKTSFKPYQKLKHDIQLSCIYLDIKQPLYKPCMNSFCACKHAYCTCMHR